VFCGGEGYGEEGGDEDGAEHGLAVQFYCVGMSADAAGTSARAMY
jgi:hypothetical protein